MEGWLKTAIEIFRLIISIAVLRPTHLSKFVREYINICLSHILIHIDLYQISFYPRATSSIIIMVNPIMQPAVARCVLSWEPLCASGMSSSTTTYIIAPAANASA